MRSGADPNPMKEVHREQHISMLSRNILGCCITLAALKNRKFGDLNKSIGSIATEMKGAVKNNKVKSEKQFNDALDRYVFLERPK
jgi:hypothetical protein